MHVCNYVCIINMEMQCLSHYIIISKNYNNIIIYKVMLNILKVGKEKDENKKVAGENKVPGPVSLELNVSEREVWI